MRIGLSYDQGTPKYRLYADRLREAAATTGAAAEIVWLASPGRGVDRAALRSIDALVLTGGSDVEPQRYGRGDAAAVCRTFDGRDAAELEILERALDREVPLLAICRGMQLFNVYQGGTLDPDIVAAGHRLSDDERHDVRLEANSMLAGIVGSSAGSVTSSHHQAVADVGHGLRIVGRHADGTVEAIEWAEPSGRPWLAAIQWHPERMRLNEAFAGPLYRNFLAAAAAGVSTY